MTLHVVPIPDPPAGADWQAYVPGRYFYDVTGLTATIARGSLPRNVMTDVSPNGRNGTYTVVTAPGNFQAGAVVGDTAVDLGPNAPLFQPLGLRIPAAATSFTGDFGICWWAKRTLFSGGAPDVVAWTAGNAPLCSVGVLPGGALQGFINGTGAQGQTAALLPFTNTWHMIGIDYAAGTGLFTFYFDGVVRAKVVNIAGGPLGAPPDHVTMGLDAGGFPVMNEQLDELAFFPFQLGAVNNAALFALRPNFAGYTAAALALAPSAYYHLDDVFVTPGGVEPSLVISDGTHDVEVIPPGFLAVATPGPYRYSWTPALNADTQSSDGTLTTVATGPIRVPGGYLIGTRTLDIQPGDQWSNVVLQWDDQYMMSLPEFNPYNYPPGANLIFQQIGAGP